MIAQRGDYEVHHGYLVKFDWYSRRRNWIRIRPLTRWERLLHWAFRIVPV